MEVNLINGHELIRSMRRCDLAAKACVTDDLGLGPHTVRDGQRVELKHLHAAMKSGHMSVLEHCTLTFAIEGISRACSHQFVRHRLMSFEQLSQRYVRMDGFGYVEPESIMQMNIDNKVWSDGHEDWVTPHKAFGTIMEVLSNTYEALVKAGVPEEDARYILPNACCTNIVVTMNLREFMHFCGLRRCSRAQWEIREMADKMAEEVISYVPWLKDWLGPQCETLGYCPEAKSCGRVAKKKDIVNVKDTPCPVVVHRITQDGGYMEWER